MDYQKPLSMRELKSQNLAFINSDGIKGLRPVHSSKKSIAESTWGKLWCKNLERYEVFAPCLPRGRSLLKSYALLNIEIDGRFISGKVRDPEVYDVDIEIVPVDLEKWQQYKKDNTFEINNLMDFLQGNIPQNLVDSTFCEHKGIFPEPPQLRPSCTCPSYEMMCPHAATLLYGFGISLDQNPHQLFDLIGVNVDEIMSLNESLKSIDIKEDEIGDLFGIELDDI